MLWVIRIAFFVLVLLFVLAVATSCSWRIGVRNATAPVAVEEPIVAEPVVVDPVLRTEVLAAQTRRTQLIGEIARLVWIQQRTKNMDARIALDIAISDRRAELARLDGLIGVR